MCLLVDVAGDGPGLFPLHSADAYCFLSLFFPATPSGIILLFCLGCMVFMMFILAPTLGKTELSEKTLLIVLFVVTVVLSCLALRKVYQRWRFSSSQQVIEAVPEGGEYARAEDIIIEEDLANV